jgi:TRAP-type C4-dicarboxylate transport system permease small subunit
MTLPRSAANAVGGLLFATLFGVFLVQITARFFFNRPLPWTDEAAVALYVWVILWAAAFMVPEREHVAFDLVWNACSPRGRALLRCVTSLLIGGLCLAGVPASWDYVHFMARESSPVLGVPFQVVYLPFVLLLLAIGVRSVFTLWHNVAGLAGWAGLPADLIASLPAEAVAASAGAATPAFPADPPIPGTPGTR